MLYVHINEPIVEAGYQRSGSLRKETQPESKAVATEHATDARLGPQTKRSFPFSRLLSTGHCLTEIKVCGQQ